MIPIQDPLADTIVAAASAPGTGCRSILRLSGPSAVTIAGRLFDGGSRSGLPFPLRQRLIPALARVEDPAGGIPVEIAGHLQVSPGRRSFTGEPAVEFHSWAPEPLLKVLIGQCEAAGARLAQPGEFTLRAFLAGRLDLTQAEALLEVIHARDETEFGRALAQLSGGLAGPFRAIRESLLDLLADLEAGLDFADEDIEFIDRKKLASVLDRALEDLTKVGVQMRSRESERAGFRVVLVGPPNSGKSSLFNALTASRNAIVSPESGTTRDYLVGRIGHGAGFVELVDTAGLDRTVPAESVSGPGAEKDAVSRQLPTPGELAQIQTDSAARQADLVLYCTVAADLAGCAGGIRDSMRSWAATIPVDPGRILQVGTKSDLGSAGGLPSGTLLTSATNGEGLEELRRQIIEKAEFRDQNGTEVVPSTLLRCESALAAGMEELQNARLALQQGAGDEIIAVGLRLALDAIGRISGAVVTDDVLGRIFSRFCIGK